MNHRTVRGLILVGLILCGYATAGAQTRRDPEVERVLAQFVDEPTIWEVQRAAVNFYHVAPEKVESLRQRARNKNFLPTVSGWVQNSTGNMNGTLDDIIFRARIRDSGPKEITRQSSDYLGYNFSATWVFPQVIFNAEELDVLALIGIQDGVIREVTTDYYIRRRLQVSMLLNPGATVEARISDEMRLQELTGLLDGMTGGFLTRRINELRARRMAQQVPGGAPAQPADR